MPHKKGRSKALGIGSYIDYYLATTNLFKTAKVGGLFSPVLAHLEISSDDLVYIGDTEVRDIEPAMAAGIFSVKQPRISRKLLPRQGSLTNIRIDGKPVSPVAKECAPIALE